VSNYSVKKWPDPSRYSHFSACSGTGPDLTGRISFYEMESGLLLKLSFGKGYLTLISLECLKDSPVFLKRKTDT
jgi:hypothetical protein